MLLVVVVVGGGGGGGAWLFMKKIYNSGGKFTDLEEKNDLL